MAMQPLTKEALFSHLGHFVDEVLYEHDSPLRKDSPLPESCQIDVLTAALIKETPITTPLGLVRRLYEKSIWSFVSHLETWDEQRQEMMALTEHLLIARKVLPAGSDRKHQRSHKIPVTSGEPRRSRRRPVDEDRNC